MGSKSGKAEKGAKKKTKAGRDPMLDFSVRTKTFD